MKLAQSPHQATNSGQWWHDFDRVTLGGTTPYLFNSPLGCPLVDPQEIDYVISNVHAARGRGARLRIYVEESRRNDAVARFLSGPPRTNDSAFAWIQETLGSPRIAFLINDLQDWSETAAHAAGSFLREMYSARGMPPGGVELILFAGNYARTPFGAHRGYEHAFLFHCGPGEKDFHLWSPEVFQRLTGSLEDIANYEHLLPYATSLVLRPGDMLYLPAQWFHVGEQQSYSCSIAAALYQPRPAELLRALFESDSPLTSALPYSPANLNEFPLRDSIVEDAHRVVAEELGPFLDHLWLKRLSNAGLVCTDESLYEQVKLSPHNLIKLHRPWLLCWSVEPGSERWRIYLRHRCVRLRYHQALPALFNLLNEGEFLEIGEVCVALEDSWTMEATIGAFEALTRLGGFDVS